MTRSSAVRWESALQNNYGTPGIALTHGEGAQVWDSSGKRYLDLLGGIATNLLGHGNSEIMAAIATQGSKLSHVSNFYSHEPVIALAEKLQQFTGDPTARTFFCNSGAEANEAALKLSRLTGRTKVLATQGAFHGRTMGALSLTGQPSKRDPFKPLIKGIKHLPFGDIDAARKALSKKVAMFIVEPIQGENGVVVPPVNYLQELRELTHATGTLLAFDCVQTGMGRTGAWFGYESSGITPDIITLAKGLGAGLPLGATIAMGEAAALFTPGSHGSTFGGNPIVCAAANVQIAIIEREGLLASNRVKGNQLKAEIAVIAGVDHVRGEGLLLGIVLAQPIAKRIYSDLMDRGFLTNATSDSVIRIAPAYTITNAQLSEFVVALKEVLVHG
jgi:acetylornithine aminotransferase